MDIVDYEELLARGIRAARANKHEEAKRYLSFAVRARPQAAQAWLWLAAACTEPQEQIDCLQRVLHFDAANLPARILLQRLGALSPEAELLPLTQAGTTNPARAFTCPQCGGHQRFDPEERSLTCINCGTAEDLSEVKNAAHDERRLTSSILRKPSGENWALLGGAGEVRKLWRDHDRLTGSTNYELPLLRFGQNFHPIAYARSHSTQCAATICV